MSNDPKPMTTDEMVEANTGLRRKEYIRDFLNKGTEVTVEDLKDIGTNNFWFYFDEDPFMSKHYVPEKKRFGGLWKDILANPAYDILALRAVVKEFKSIKSITATLDNDRIKAGRNPTMHFDEVAYNEAMAEKGEIATRMDALMRPIFIEVASYFIENKLDLANVFN